MSDTESEFQEQLTHARGAIQASQFPAAAKILDGLLAVRPEHEDALYMRAVCGRYLKDFATAETCLDRLHHTAPEFGRGFQEAGHLYRAQNKSAEALAAYLQATRLNPALRASWTAQARLLRLQGRTQEAQQAEAQATRLAQLPKLLLVATNHLHEGRILKAEELARAFLRKVPHHVEGMRLLAEVGARLGVLDDAEFLLESAIDLEPDNIQLRLDYIQVLRKRQKFALALAQAKALKDRDPGNPVFLSHFAIESLQSGNYETALEAFETVLQALPADPAVLTSRGHALKTYGRTEEAVRSYRAAYQARPDHGDAYYSLANLKTYRFSDRELRDMQTQLENPRLSFASRVHICFALGKAFEDRGEVHEAFEHYAMGNALKQKQTRYTAEQMSAEFEAQKALCDPDLFAAQSGRGDPSPDPIFIVGLPRAGSTLLEQILASHSQVDGTLELPNVLSLAHRLRGRQLLTDRHHYPRVLRELDSEALSGLGRDYIDNTRLHRKGAPFFTDKMPNNFRHIGLIHLMLPRAKIIDARRDPMDCCWSGFKQLFAEGQEFTYSLSDIGAYYRGYVDLMAHWHRVLPAGRILQVDHDRVIDDVEGEVRRILDYCDLPFEPACVAFHKTERAVRTASSEQVRQPINRAGQGQWRPFAPYLGPLKAALGPDLLPEG